MHQRLSFWFYRILFRLSEEAPTSWLQHIVNMRLRRILSLAREIPFWQNRIHNSSPHTLGQVIWVAKSDFQDTPLNYINHAVVPNRRLRRSTSGSTGVPFIFYRGKDESPEHYALALRGYRWAGRRQRDRVVQTFSSHAANPPFWGIFPHDNPSDLDWSRFILYQMLKGNHSTLLFSFPSFVIPLSEFWDQDKPQISLRSLILVGEHLMPSARTRLERIFKAPVYLGYATREFGLIAQECDRREGMHLFVESVLLEIVNSEGIPLPTGETGEVLLTSLMNTTMPLIRFRIGDRGKFITTPCPCGKTLPRIEIIGRETALLPLSGGKTLYLVEIQRALMESFGNLIMEFQLYQETLEKLTLYIVALGHADLNLKDRIAKTLTSITNNEPLILVEIVDSLPERGLLKRAFFSKLGHPMAR